MGSRSHALLVGVLVALMASPGCGMLINGRRQKIVITSDPEGAKVKILGTGKEGTTPMVVQLGRKEDYEVTFEKEGYKKKKVYMAHEIEPMALVMNIIFNLGIGILVDWPVGAAHELVPDRVSVTLTKE